MVMSDLKKVLHVGCGAANPDKLPSFLFTAGEWREIRLDINPSVDPDIIGTITDMSAIESGSVDAVWSSHNLEHLYPHEVPVALTEFYRVVKPGGFAAMTMPDVEQIARQILAGGLEDPAYVSKAGPITPLDMLFGLRVAMANGNLYMAHRTGFTEKTLRNALQEAGFRSVVVEQDTNFALWAIGRKNAA
jgi:ubiquinone/menaquinone biosynthesis C-methylase UbiE